MGIKNRLIPCVAIAAALGLANVGRAQTVTAQLTGIDPFFFGVSLSLDGNSQSGDGAGLISWDGAGFSNPTPFNGDFNTFCLDLEDPIGFGGTYSFNIDNNIATAPKPSAGGPMGASAALEMQALYGEQFNSLATSDDLTAFQLDIWAIVYNTFGDDSVNNSNYNFFVQSGIDSNAISEANTWLAQAYNSALTDSGTFDFGLEALIGQTQAGTDSSAQDQIFLGVSPITIGGGLPPTGVPEINASAAASLAIMLLGALALFENAKPRRPLPA
jgi:hypothetical protein